MPSPTPIPTPTPHPAEALNISTRAQVGTADDALIGGFIVTGDGAKKVILRALGPSLGGGVANPLADPILELHEPDGTVVTNDNWRSGQETAILESGLAPVNDLESAIIRTLDPGAYTAVVRGKNGTVGVGLVEASISIKRSLRRLRISAPAPLSAPGPTCSSAGSSSGMAMILTRRF